VSDFGVFVAFYDNVKQRVANSMRESLTAMHPEFIPGTLSDDLANSANACTPVLVGNADGACEDEEEEEDEEEDEEEEVTGDEESGDDEEDEESKADEGAASEIVSVPHPPLFSDSLRLLVEVPCRTVLVLDHVPSSFFNLEAAPARPVKTLLETSVLPPHLTSDPTLLQQHVKTLQARLLEKKLASGAEHAWLVLFQPGTSTLADTSAAFAATAPGAGTETGQAGVGVETVVVFYCTAQKKLLAVKVYEPET
jgi:hypothetical protein